MHVYVVLGMARSGTSAIASGVAALGVSFGDNLATADGLWNPKGFWEDNDVVYKVNRGVIYAIDSEWMSTGKIAAFNHDNPNLKNLKKYAYDLLKARLEKNNYYGFKDPRTAKLLPFWQSVFEQLPIEDHYVITVRNPLASAYSYHRVTGVDVELGLLLWVMHLLPAVESTHHKNRVFVSYDSMLVQPETELRRIKQQLAIPDLASADSVQQYAHEFLDKKLQHYQYTREDLQNHPATAIVPMCITMYDLLLKVAHDEMNANSPEWMQAWSVAREAVVKAYPTLQYIDTLLNRSKASERELRTMRRSLPWKLAYPFRLVDDLFRSWRVKSRLQKRLLASYGK